MGKRALGMDPQTGVMSWMDYDELTDTWTTSEEADVTAFLENNKRLYNDAPKRWNEGAVHTSLHPLMRTKLMHEGIIRTHIDNDPEPYRRWCNDSDNRAWRIKPGKIDMDLTTYDGLVAAVADYLNRQELTDQIPAFISMAHAQFNRELRLRDMQVRAYTTSNAENVELPSDWLEHYSLTLATPTSSGWALRYMSERESNDLKAGLQGAGGTPAGYTVIANMIELVPAPGGDVDLRMVYYARIPDLSTTAQSNWLLQKSPDVYLYSALLQAEPFLNNDARLPLWAQLRTAIVEAMKLESEASLRPRSQLTSLVRAF